MQSQNVSIKGKHNGIREETGADWHVAAARARGRDKSGPYSAAARARGRDKSGPYSAAALVRPAPVGA
ncbi:MAG TPA: hypothetical protein VNG51_27845 [Ktedonobacteraceae bacterium]|nr:hypothetical protein [Ktedonobacteraceae bacterium]